MQRVNPKDTVLKKALKVTYKAFERVKDAKLQNFVHEFTVRIADFVRKKGQAGLYQHLKSLELEGKKQSDSTYIRSATGELSRDKQAILQRWEEWFDTLLSATYLQSITPSSISSNNCQSTHHSRRSPRWQK